MYSVRFPSGSIVALTLPIASDGPKDPAKLTGVLTSATGWLPDGSLRGLQIDLALPAATEGAASAASPESAGGSGGGGAATAPKTTGFAATLALAFIGGLILNLMPCVFPVLGIKILGFVNQSGHDRGKVAAPGVYALGLPFMRTRKSSFIAGAGEDAEALADHLENFLAGAARAAA